MQQNKFYHILMQLEMLLKMILFGINGMFLQTVLL